VLEILARAYCAQVFDDGLFHADPHPGNLFVVDEPGARPRPRLLFVDFGCRAGSIPRCAASCGSASTRCCQQNVPAFLDGMERLGAIAPGHRDDVGAPSARCSRACAARRSRRARVAGAVAQGPGRGAAARDARPALPVDLLLYAKTLSYVFSLGAELDPGST
jgi:predicted unusual protein kinase regulating ubiquinone biosynthesis (AarF/ABC1/UbiB family)